MRMTNKSLGAIALVTLFLVGGAMFLHDRQPHPASGSTATTFLASPVRVGGYLLIPNRYRIEPIADGSEHFVVFTKIFSDYTGSVGREGKEVARVKCTLAPLAEEADNMALSYSTINTAGEYVLSEIHFAGGHVRHLF